eukprot:CAMPEP_0117498538 /NCGR_PEP_ID=MMETSP0784-20121206/21768_1 /TAXON_ID=39447 /ORGANISM="" /LENGTH=69 /DNA_ID=CAMNT_0005293631 /DNA_START=62 /DNA_END=268 /DNA_ORIENTATION=-
MPPLVGRVCSLLVSGGHIESDVYRQGAWLGALQYRFETSGSCCFSIGEMVCFKSGWRDGHPWAERVRAA